MGWDIDEPRSKLPEERNPRGHPLLGDGQGNLNVDVVPSRLSTTSLSTRSWTSPCFQGHYPNYVRRPGEDLHTGAQDRAAMTSTCVGMSTLHWSSTSPFPMTTPWSTRVWIASRLS